MKHAGIHWPENAGGEHPNRETIAAMPGMAGAALICSPSARYHYDYLRQRNPAAVVVWRAIPRQGKLPAQLGWDGGRVAAECLNLWNEQPHGGTEWFTPLNELQFVKESGEEFAGYARVAGHLGNLREALRKRLPATVTLIFPAWVPQDDGDRLHEWQDEARRWDAIGLHCYGSAEVMRARYDSYRNAFPDRPLFVGEWNSNHEGHDERDSLQMWAEVADTDPLFLGATYYIWETNNAGERDLSIWGNGARYGLFAAPPTVTHVPDPEPIPPEPETPMAPDRWQHWTAQEIAQATGCPVGAISEHWPRLVEQLNHCGITDRPVQTAMLATVAIETASRFEPIHEFRNADGSIPAIWYTYEGGPEFHGRGFIQNTHRSSYAELGPKIAALWGTSPDQPDLDFVTYPDNILQPDVSAAAAAVFFRDKAGGAIPPAARAGDWREVRRLVQGGTAGLDRLVQIVGALGGTVPAGEERTYGPNVPDDVILQRNSWSCAVRATYAALWALQQQGQGQGVSYGDEGAADVYEWLVPAYDQPGVGLLDHTGAGLAEALRKHGYPAAHYYPVSLDAVREVAGKFPVLLGGDTWNHWAYVRGKTADNGLILENPSPGHAGISDYLRDSFGRLGPMAMVVIDGPQVQAPAVDYASLTGLAYNEDGVVVPALAVALANPDDANLRLQVDAVVRWLRENRPPAA
jgi:hypothetical protein